MDINVTNNENYNVMRHYIKRLLICIAILTANTAAWATDYVITYTVNGTTHFLSNNEGNIADTNVFNPSTCIWTGTTSDSGVKLKNGDYYISKYYSLELSKNSNDAVSWTISDNKIYYYYSYYYYYILFSNTWTTQYVYLRKTIPSTTASCYTISTAESVGANPTTATITQTASRFKYQGDETDFNLSSFSYTPAYTYYTVGDNNSTKYYCTTDGTYVGNTPPDKITSGFTYKWQTTAPKTNVTLSKDTEATAHAKYDKKVDTETTATATVTATIPKTGSFMTTDATVTGTTNITLSNLLVPTISLNVPNEVYIGESVSGSLTTSSDGVITYNADPSSYVELTKNTSDSKKFTVKGNAVASGNTESLVQITAKVAASNTYIASFTTANITVKKRPTTLTLSYDKNTLTYGEAAPVLTCKVTDTYKNEEVSNPDIYYSSSETFLTVDNKTGAITNITKAGTAVITAHYTGDDTYAAAEDAKFTITVNKAKTTVTFGDDDNYFVRFTDGFKNAPTATLTPSAAGSVTYSCTSSPEGLVTVNSSTGEVTLADVNGTMEGSATIKASFAGNDGYESSEASYTLTVSTRLLPDFDVTMENSLYVDDNTHSITVKTNSSGSLSYSSDNTAVLEVDKTTGLMNAKSAGTANVTITMEGDNDYIPMEATFTVTVKRYPTTLTIDNLDAEYYTDHADIPLSVSLTDMNGNGVSGETGKYTYASTNTSVLTVSQNASGSWVIKPVGAGIASVTVTFEGDDKYEGSHASKQITVKRTAMPGDFIRIKNASGNYLTATADVTSTTATPTIEWSSTTTDKDASNIIYYGTDGSLLFYQCGRYISNATTKPELADVVDKDGKGTEFTITRDGDKYTISESNGTGNLGNANTADLTVEIVDYLPLTFKDAGYGYSTFYSPVNLRTPAGVSAYYATERKDGASNNVDYIITLKEVLHGVMPANTPLVLKASDITTVKTYDFYIIDETSDIKDDLKDFMAGTLPTIKTSSVYKDTQCPYTLQPTSNAETVGFYPWKSDNHPTIEPFRCYIPGANVKKSASQAKGFRFVFDGDDTTAVESIEVPAATATSDIIYNLQGIAVGTDINALPAGVYIQGGKKVRK